MSDLKISRRYAKALFQFAVEENMVGVINNDMLLLSDTCKNSKELRDFLKSPIIRAKKKMEVIKSIFQSQFKQITINYIKIITTHRRENLLPLIAEQFVELNKAEKGIKVAKLKTAMEIDSKTQKMIVELLEKQMGAKVELNIEQHEDMIGGFILTVDNNEIDTSIKSKLLRLRAQFDGNPYERKI